MTVFSVEGIHGPVGALSMCAFLSKKVSVIDAASQRLVVVRRKPRHKMLEKVVWAL
jgi:hypothetical protein